MTRPANWREAQREANATLHAKITFEQLQQQEGMRALRDWSAANRLIGERLHATANAHRLQLTRIGWSDLADALLRLPYAAAKAETNRLITAAAGAAADVRVPPRAVAAAADLARTPAESAADVAAVAFPEFDAIKKYAPWVLVGLVGLKLIGRL